MIYSRSFCTALLALLSSSYASSANKTVTCHPAHSSWNGQSHLPHDHSPSCGHTFSPYFIPSGAISIDDNDSRAIYSPSDAWKQTTNRLAVGSSSHTSDVAGANVSITFMGTGIELFGHVSPRSRVADMYIDGTLAGSPNLRSSESRWQQRLFGISHLEHGQHTLTVVNDPSSKGSLLDIDAFVVTPGSSGARPSGHARIPANPRLESRAESAWTLEQKGQTGVAAMQLAIVSDTEAIIIDKVEHNPLSINGHPAWGAIYNLDKHTVRPLNMQTNSFCAGGGFLGNGTLINVGGNPVVEDKTGAVDFGDKNGLQGVRLYTPCSDGTCGIYDNPSHLRMKSPRWYATVTRLEDGSAMIIGGSTRGGWINNKTDNNPTIEYFPSKSIGKEEQVTLPFLKDTLNSNLFPIAFTLPDGRVFMAANNDATVYDWRKNSETRLPAIPNGVRVTYPMTGTAVLLPLSPSNNYRPEVLLCGGSSLDDHIPGSQLSAQDPASKQCARMILDDAGISAGWQVEEMPDARIMPDAVLLPDGRIVVVNGGRSGIAGYGNTKHQVGSSNADDPVYTPVLYDPDAPIGQRFTSTGMPTSSIARLYHSVATLTPEGSIMIAGSNPNLDRSNTLFGTEFRVEWLYPDYMTKSRPVFTKLPDRILFGKSFELEVGLPDNTKQVKVSLIDLGFVTHSVHMNSRLVELESVLGPDGRILGVHAPPSGLVYPPGPGWIYVLADGIPSRGKKVMVGDGGNL